MTVWWLPRMQMLWRATASPSVNRQFIEQHLDAVLLIRPEYLDDSILSQLARHPGTLVSVTTHEPADPQNA